MDTKERTVITENAKELAPLVVEEVEAEVEVVPPEVVEGAGVVQVIVEKVPSPFGTQVPAVKFAPAVMLPVQEGPVKPPPLGTFAVQVVLLEVLVVVVMHVPRERHEKEVKAVVGHPRTLYELETRVLPVTPQVGTVTAHVV
jgi:hypothetical protein